MTVENSVIHCDYRRGKLSYLHVAKTSDIESRQSNFADNGTMLVLLVSIPGITIKVSAVRL